jgi:hypothetical protein
MAFSAPEFSPNLQDAIDYAWSKGVIVVAAVGNNGVGTATFPAGDRGVMGVAATDASDTLAAFSNSGQAVFIAARAPTSRRPTSTATTSSSAGPLPPPPTSRVLPRS